MPRAARPDCKRYFKHIDAWRRVVVPVGARSKAQLHPMHKVVHNPPTSKRLGDGLEDLDKREEQHTECYKCGGPMVPDGTKVFIAMGMLPASTSLSAKPALKGIRNYATFKDALRDNVPFLKDH